MSTTYACIFANGELPDLDRLQSLLKPEDYLVAADGGLKHLHCLGRSPSVLIGDLDSVSAEEVSRVERAGGQVIQYPVHKDETDLELALQLVLQNGFRHIRVVGALGGRLDMTLANICLLMLPGLADVDARLEDGTEEVFFIYPGYTGKLIEGQRGDRLSLLPWGGPATGIWTENLFYPLTGETLYPDRSRGISNRLTSQTARVTIEAGLLVCIHTRFFGQGEPA